MNCTHEGGRRMYIHPDECVDYGACEPVCPVEAIYEDDLPDRWSVHAEDNVRWFSAVLPGRTAPSGSPGFASRLGALTRRHGPGADVARRRLLNRR